MGMLGENTLLRFLLVAPQMVWTSMKVSHNSTNIPFHCANPSATCVLAKELLCISGVTLQITIEIFIQQQIHRGSLPPLLTTFIFQLYGVFSEHLAKIQGWSPFEKKSGLNHLRINICRVCRNQSFKLYVNFKLIPYICIKFHEEPLVRGKETFPICKQIQRQCWRKESCLIAR